MSLSASFRCILSNWRTFFVCVILWVVAGCIGVSIYPKKWEAQVYIRLGQVAGQAIESTSVAAARIGSFASLKAVIESLSEVADDNSLERVRSNLQIQKIDERVLLLKIRAERRDLAENLLRKVVDEVVRQHRERAATAINSLNSVLASAEANNVDLNNIGGRRGRADSRSSNLLSGPKFSDLALIRANSIMMLNPPETEDTATLNSIYVSGDPVSPRRSLVILLCGIFGIATALVLVFSDETGIRQRR